ncbi:MAG: hypothetical protein WCR23_12685, partial [Planctomycetota bacterium]
MLLELRRSQILPKLQALRMAWTLFHLRPFKVKCNRVLRAPRPPSVTLASVAKFAVNESALAAVHKKLWRISALY